MTLYDEIGTTYSAVRRPDPRAAPSVRAAGRRERRPASHFVRP
ncbi:hypothetical protein [Microbispora sp. H10670]|nr:hypothetical protein [Microbispora sp. H10670]